MVEAQAELSMLRPLLDALSRHELETASALGWAVERVAGGANNLLFRAAGPPGELAIKFTIRDERDRAGREYWALRALHEAGLPIAPAPVLLDRHSYQQPVVVQRWLAGAVSAVPPEDDDGWLRLVEHFVAIHSLTPAATELPVARSVLTATSLDECLTIIEQQLAVLPPAARPAELPRLLQRLGQRPACSWPPPVLGLCRTDANTLNFVRRPGAWASVDWENAGWGDPAFELAELRAHPAYAQVPQARWAWVVEAYCLRAGGVGLAQRVELYYQAMLLWWVARMARYLYELPRGLDARLARRTPGWERDLQAKYERYLHLAQALL